MGPPNKPIKVSKSLYTAVSVLLYGWWDSIMKAPEIEKIISNNPKNYFRNKRVQISDCSAERFINNHGGISILRTGKLNIVKRYILSSVEECMKTIAVGNEK